MKLFRIACISLVLTFACLSVPVAHATEVVIPSNRTGFRANEPIEIAVAALPAGEKTSLDLTPTGAGGATPLKIEVVGTGSTVTVVLPPMTLAPGAYKIRVGGQDASEIRIASGIPASTMLVSQTSTKPGDGGSNFCLGNALGFGLLDPKGGPLLDVRSRRLGGVGGMFDSNVANNLPIDVYMYWTGYTTHKPWGTEKSWAAPDMQDAMRQFNFFTAQRLRKFGESVIAIGPIDEPGLSWGKTPAGGSASGFPNWDEQEWYAKRGWTFTSEIAKQSDADWMKYMDIRCAIMKESYAQASADVKSTWPEAHYSGDLYAPSAIMDGTDPMNQQANEDPTTHVFFDWYGGPWATTGLIYLEKSHDPTAPVAHAMNGQLDGVRSVQPTLYRVLMNAMLAAGLKSNWWLNTGGMTNDDLLAVNETAARVGPLLRAMSPADHDVAILWSYTQAAMQQKAMTASESTKVGGTQIKLMVPIPEKGETVDAEYPISAYEIGYTYVGRLMMAHQACTRAGYPAHLIHEKMLPKGALKNYKTLVIVEQTFDFPPDVRAAIDEFVKAGGKIVTDKATKITLPAGTIVHDADLSVASFRSRAAAQARDVKAVKSPADASVFKTNLAEQKYTYSLVPAIKTALQKTAARPALKSDGTDLPVERHVGGEGAVYLVLNGFEKVPTTPPDANGIPRYNPAPLDASFTLQGIAPGSVVYCIEGTDWKHVSRVEKFDQPQSAHFEAGEMKLYLVAPREPGSLETTAKLQGNTLLVSSKLPNVKMAWPITVTVTAPDGKEIYHLNRATSKDGTLAETLPLGSNAPAGTYRVSVTSPVGALTSQAEIAVTPTAQPAKTLAEDVRVFDEPAVRKLLGSKTKLTIACGNDSYKPAADQLAKSLTAKGLTVSVVADADVLHKATYPRVWNPYAMHVTPSAQETKEKPEKMVVKHNIEVGTDASGKITIASTDGQKFDGDWKQPNTLVTVSGEGLCNWRSSDNESCYEPGVVVYVNEQLVPVVIKGESKQVQTTAEFRKRWSRPWQTLGSYVGECQLPPELPEAFTATDHLIVLGDSHGSFVAAVLQASELLPQIVDAKYPGPGKALIQYAWSPFAIEKDVIYIGSADAKGLDAGVAKLVELARN